MSLLEAPLAWFAGGGPVMYAILAVGLALYAVVVERVVTLYGKRERTEDDLRRGLTVLRALVAAAPLLGLLGTVSGMIASFEGLVDGGHIASIGEGIGYALRTTQYGLAVAVPGIVLERIISRRSHRLTLEDAG